MELVPPLDGGLVADLVLVQAALLSILTLSSGICWQSQTPACTLSDLISLLGGLAFAVNGMKNEGGHVLQLLQLH